MRALTFSMSLLLTVLLVGCDAPEPTSLDNAEMAQSKAESLVDDEVAIEAKANLAKKKKKKLELKANVRKKKKDPRKLDAREVRQTEGDTVAP